MKVFSSILVIAPLCFISCGTHEKGKARQEKDGAAVVSTPSHAKTGVPLRMPPVRNPAKPLVLRGQPINLSQNPKMDIEDGFGFYLELGTAQSQAQIPEWDVVKKQGLLQFGMGIVYTAADYAKNPRIPGSTSLYTCDEKNYLFTKVDQRQIDEKYDNGEAGIFLQYAGREIQVGKYRKQVKVGNAHTSSSSLLGDEFHTWLHPELCENEFAKICSVTFQAKRVPTVEDYPVFLAEIKIFLKDGESEAEAFSAKSAIRPVYTSFKHFGCEFSQLND